MIKKILMHSVYILLIVFFVVLSQIKATEAEKQTELAIEYETMALENAETARKSAAEAKRAHDQAEYAMLLAQKERTRAEKLLEKCQGN